MKRSFLIGVICVGVAVLTVLTVIAVILGGGQRPVFQDVTVELGSKESLSIWDFLTDPPKINGSAFVSDVSRIDLSKPGATPITMRHGKKLYRVTLTVQDTTAPAVSFQKELTLPLGTQVRPEDFVISAEDLSPISTEFITAPQDTGTYSDQTVEVAVSDLYGNTVTSTATLRYDWINTDITLELGTPLTKEHILIDPEKDGELISQDAINEINLAGAGTYTLTVESGSSIRNCTITVQDTLPPEVVLKQVSLFPTHWCEMEDFIESVYDASGSDDVKLELLSELPFGQEGNHTVLIKATDKNGISCTVQTLLRIHYDLVAPSIYGLTDMKITANTEKAPDYIAKVQARDDTDGYPEVFYDASEVDLTTPGVYYVYYTATDKTGNLAHKTRKVFVLPDYNDTDRLIADIAKSLKKTDPESLRDFVRDNITYLGPSWGGDDPVGSGFTKWYGNCYVHAMCLKALLDYFGYENELIWLMPRFNPHYWNLVKIDGVWYHIDSTPAVSHQKYSLMDNKQRLSTLKGRLWDVEKWPQIQEPEQKKPEQETGP